MSGSLPPCKAKVFISCGQRGHEDACARKIKSLLESKGFDAYVATSVQSKRGVEGIIEELLSSEYFLFVDFKRASEPGGLPVSLFAHQELAIATAHDIKCAFFQEKTVDREGIAKYLFTNPYKFKGTQQLLKRVSKVVSDWSPNWKKCLHFAEGSIDRNVSTGMTDTSGARKQCRADFFHIRVTNQHKHRQAARSVAYLVSVRSTAGASNLDGREWPIEHKWSGYKFPEALIRPGNHREFDAFLQIPLSEKNSPATEESSLSHQNSTATISIFAAAVPNPDHQLIERTDSAFRGAYFNTLTDYSGYQRRLEPGQYRFTYEVWAEKFPRTEGVFDVSIREDPSETRMKLVKQTHYYR